MSEKLKPKSHEHQPKQEADAAREKIKEMAEKLSAEAAEARKRSPEKEADEARKSIEKHHTKSKEKQPKNKEKEAQKEPVTRGIKKQTYRATMNRVEARLPAYQRAFSKVIHNNAVDKTSAVVGRTIARPSGILGSGITAFLGLLIVTYYANRIGFTLSGSEFILLIVAGWFIGLIFEGIYKAATRKSL